MTSHSSTQLGALYQLARLIFALTANLIKPKTRYKIRPSSAYQTKTTTSNIAQIEGFVSVKYWGGANTFAACIGSTCPYYKEKMRYIAERDFTRVFLERDTKMHCPFQRLDNLSITAYCAIIFQRLMVTGNFCY